MSWTIWNELDTPARPLTQDGEHRVMAGANVGYAVADLNGGEDELELLDMAVEAFNGRQITVSEHLVGISFGVHARRSGDNVDDRESTGFTLFRAADIQRLRIAKGIGTHVAELKKVATPLEVFRENLAAARKQKNPVIRDSVGFAGLAIGIREFHLQGVPV